MATLAATATEIVCSLILTPLYCQDFFRVPERGYPSILTRVWRAALLSTVATTLGKRAVHRVASDRARTWPGWRPRGSATRHDFAANMRWGARLVFLDWLEADTHPRAELSAGESKRLSEAGDASADLGRRCDRDVCRASPVRCPSFHARRAASAADRQGQNDLISRTLRDARNGRSRFPAAAEGGWPDVSATAAARRSVCAGAPGGRVCRAASPRSMRRAQGACSSLIVGGARSDDPDRRRVNDPIHPPRGLA